MHNVSCPGCGAQVAFRSTASVMAVCEYCQTTVLKDADSVRDYGKMSDVLADYSRIQIGTSGTFGGQGFIVIGRIQLRYDAGIWNEWYVLFDDGHGSWLSDASGLYTLTTQRAIAGVTPPFDVLAPGQGYTINGNRYVAADIRSADCIGGQGELPFQVGPGWQARVADFRSGDQFATLDYSDAAETLLYTGQAVVLEALQCQMLREDDTVQASAGKFTGTVSRLGCPACGSNVDYVPGLTTHLMCPNCSASVDTTPAVAEVLAAGKRLESVKTTLALGAEASIGGVPYTLIGLMQRRDEGSESWTEYLLFAPRAGFLWLIETGSGWFRSRVLDQWPIWHLDDTAMLGPQSYSRTENYTARVTFAAGAFNWRVNIGDETQVSEFENGRDQLSAERTAQELTWSQSNPVPADQINAWFKTAVVPASRAAPARLTTTAHWFAVAIALFNAVPLLLSFGHTWFLSALALACIYAPALYFDRLDERT